MNLNSKFIKFMIVGGSAFVIDVGGYFLLTRFLKFPYLLARFISIIAAFIWNFIINRYWTYQAKDGVLSIQLKRFTITMVCTYSLSLLLMKLAVGVLKLPDISSLIIISMIIAVINYFIHKNWSYASGKMQII